MKGKRLPRSTRLLSLLVAALTTASVLPLLGAGVSGDPEEEGDRLRARAEPAYRRALLALEMAQRLSGRIGDARGSERALRLRAGLLVTLLDARSFAALLASRESPGGGPEITAVALPLTITDTAAEAPQPDEESLRALSVFLGEAGRAYFRSAEKEERDLPLLFESLALSERLLGDIYQARADSSYRTAIALPEGALRDTTMAAQRAALGRLHYKLRDFPGARRALEPLGVEDPRLSGPERLGVLRILRDLALFGGEQAEALERRLIELGEKAEEIPLPSAPLGSFIAGTSADLTRTARTLLAAAAARALSTRDRLITEYLAGQAILESGQPAAAAEVLEPLLARLPLEPGHRPAQAPPLPDEDPWIAAGIQARLGEARDRAGDHEGAVAGYRGALRALAGLHGVERYRARVAISAAAALFALGQLEEARRAALEVLAEKSLTGDLRVRCRIVLSGILQVAAGESSTGLLDALSALSLAERERREAGLEEEPPVGSRQAPRGTELRALILAHTSNVHLKRARLCEAKGEAGRVEAQAARREATLSAEEALTIASATAGLERLAAACAANLGELYLEAGDLSRARERVEAALSAARRLWAFETEWRAHWYLARIALLEEDPATADRELEEAARIVEEHRARILDADRKVGFMVQKVGLYEAMVRRALEKGDGQRAFLATERSRARSFVESLGLRFLFLAADRDRAVYREYLSLLSRAEEQARGGGELFGIRAAGSYEELRSKLKALRKKIRESRGISPLVRALVEGEPAGVEAVQRDLEPGERLVEYFGAGGEVAAFVVGSTSFHALRLPAERREIESEARRFADSKASEEAVAARLGRDLLEPLLGPLEDGEPVRSVIIVPWGELHRVPFEALPVKGQYLIERYAVSYLPSASVLKYLEKPGAGLEPPRRLLAFADPHTDYDGDGRPDLPPLSGALAEVEGIAPLFPEPQVLRGAGASEEACARLLSGREIVHFACHGEFFPSRPLDSRLYLSRAGPADGLLRASEVYGIDLRGSRLVALSGCETGRSGLGAGEDPVGIGMSFLHTGAAALLVSLWKVEDQATALLMKSFYRHWLSGGGSRARALREAKLALLKGGLYAAPRHWASFVLIGPR